METLCTLLHVWKMACEEEGGGQCSQLPTVRKVALIYHVELTHASIERVPRRSQHQFQNEPFPLASLQKNNKTHVLFFSFFSFSSRL